MTGQAMEFGYGSAAVRAMLEEALVQFGESITVDRLEDLPPQTDGKAHLGFVKDGYRIDYIWNPHESKWIVFSRDEEFIALKTKLLNCQRALAECKRQRDIYFDRSNAESLERDDKELDAILKGEE